MTDISSGISAKKSKIQVLRVGSLCRVILPSFEGKFALGVVTQFQVVYYMDAPPYIMAWVDMLIDGVNRPFELENLEVLPRFVNGFDNAFIADCVAAVAAVQS